MSGCPGSLGLFTLYLNPLLHKYFRTTISGFVSLLLTAAIFLCRCSIDKYYILNGILFFLNKCPRHIFIWSFVKL